VSCSSGSVHTSPAELSKSSMEAVHHQLSTSHAPYHKAMCSVCVCLYCTQRILYCTRRGTWRQFPRVCQRHAAIRTLSSRRHDVCHSTTRELHRRSEPLDVCQPKFINSRFCASAVKLLLKMAVNATKCSIFTARCYASAVLAMGLCLSVCPCPSVSHKSEFY